MLELINVDSFYGGIKAVKNISFRVKEGQIFTILGANGAGKTTILRTIMGLKKIQRGRINFLGKNITSMPPYLRARAGITLVPEGRRLFGGLTVQDNLRTGAYFQKDKPGIARDLEKVFSLFPRLKERRNQLAGTLSGGEQQMLAIGRCLMARPRLVIMDEPSVGLMPVTVAEIFNVLAGFPHQGITVLLVEQNALKALSVAQEGLVLELGEIVLRGTSESLLNNPLVESAYLGR